MSQRFEVDFNLIVGAVSERVAVIAVDGTLQTESATLSRGAVGLSVDVHEVMGLYETVHLLNHGRFKTSISFRAVTAASDPPW